MFSGHHVVRHGLLHSFYHGNALELISITAWPFSFCINSLIPPVVGNRRSDVTTVPPPGLDKVNEPKLLFVIQHQLWAPV